MNLLFVPAALSFLAVLLEALFENGAVQVDPPTLILLAIFALAFFIPTKYHGNAVVAAAQIALETLVTSGLLILHPGWGVYPILFFLISTEASILFDLRVAFACYALFTLITAIIFVDAMGLQGLFSVLPFAAGYWFFGIFGWTRTQAEKERQRSEQLLAELQRSHAQLREYAARVEELAVVKERNRIAREVHDSLGHRLTVSAVQLEGAQRLVTADPARAEAIIATVREQVRAGLGELRQTVSMLRSPAEENLTLCEAVVALTRQFEQATGIAAHLGLAECPENLAPSYKHCFYRAVQEGLTNIQRHSGAGEVWIQFLRRDGRISLLIGDNGAGLNSTDAEQDGHFGLRGLAEQAAMLGGDFRIDPRPGGGAQLTFCLPDTLEAAHA